MTSRERVLKALHFEKTDRFPFEISWGAFTPSLMEEYRRQTGSDLDPCEYFDFDTRSVDIGPTRKNTDFSKYYDSVLPENTILNEWGVGSIPGSTEHFVEIKYHPLSLCTSVDEILHFEWPDIDADYRFAGMKEKIAEYHKKGYAVTGEMYCTIFETAWQLRGLETFLIDLYEEEEIAEAICQKLCELRIRQAQKYAELGVDILRLGDDVATQNGPLMSIPVYRKFFSGKMKQIISAAKEINPDILIFRHCDGKVEDLIDTFLEEGVEILNPVQPECNDLAAVYEKYGDRLSFWGGIGTQSTMPFGSPADVKNAVEEVQKLLGGRGALLIAPSHILEPEVPWENVIAFIDTVKNNKV